MNILINTNRPVHEQPNSVFEPAAGKSRLGEKLAAALVALYTSSALIISAWSALVLQAGIDDCGGPIQHLFEILKVTGIV